MITSTRWSTEDFLSETETVTALAETLFNWCLTFEEKNVVCQKCFPLFNHLGAFSHQSNCFCGFFILLSSILLLQLPVVLNKLTPVFIACFILCEACCNKNIWLIHLFHLPSTVVFLDVVIIRQRCQHKVPLQDAVRHREHHGADTQTHKTHTSAPETGSRVLGRENVLAHLPGSSKYTETGRPVDSANTNKPWKHKYHLI